MSHNIRLQAHHYSSPEGELFQDVIMKLKTCSDYMRTFSGCLFENGKTYTIQWPIPLQWAIPLHVLFFNDKVADLVIDQVYLMMLFFQE